MRLESIKKLEGTIRLVTGLHIGAGDAEMRIGGTDNPIVKHPHTLEPYIPGSSLKGKVRALIEMRSGLMDRSQGHPISMSHLEGLEDDDLLKHGRQIIQLFGSSGAEQEGKEELGPTRVSFSDCFLSKCFREEARQENRPLVELKSENSINRIQGVALNPRFTERATPDCRFDFSISLKRFEGDGNTLEELLLQGLSLLQLDALGGSGSRGYGRIALRFEESSIQERFEHISEELGRPEA